MKSQITREMIIRRKQKLLKERLKTIIMKKFDIHIPDLFLTLTLTCQPKPKEKERTAISIKHSGQPMS